MIAATIGGTFLKAYNAKNGTSYTAKEFVDEVFFEYFFNHPKYMLWPGNSPFVQMSSRKEDKTRGKQTVENLSPEERLEKLEELHKKISSGIIDASTAIGYPPSEVKEFSSVSGLLTDMPIDIDEETIYKTWIGGGLSIGVQGGMAIYLNDEDILLRIFEGWKVYRGLLNDVSINVLGNKITTWNGQWLNFRYNEREYREDFDYAILDNLGFFKSSDKGLEIKTVSWSRLFISLSKEYADKKIMGYVHSLGQTNTTLGFYPFYFSKARGIMSMYRKLFGESAFISDRKTYENLFGRHIKRVCELGSFGLKALEPEKLRDFYKKDKFLNLKKPNYDIKKGESDIEYEDRKKGLKQKDRDNLIIYRTYKTWLVSMITKNKKEMLDYTTKVAEVLLRYRDRSNKKTDRVNLLKKELLVANNKKKFLESLVEVLSTTISDSNTMKVDENDFTILNDLKEKVHMMTAEDFRYFVVLLRFDYTFKEREQ